MNEGKLKTAVLGLEDNGKFLLDTAYKSGYFQIQAVADKNLEFAEQVAREYQCEAYDDYRQLIIQNQFDCLLVAAGTYTCDEYIRMAMKKKANILKLAPPARNFGETAQFAGMAESENIKFAVASTGRFAKSYLAMRQFLSDPECDGERLVSPVPDNIEESLEKKDKWEPFLATVVYATAGNDVPKWRTDPKLSGGGVLLYNCYEIIDQLVLNFGMPQQVYCLNTSTAVDKQQRLYLTEDTTIVTMKYADSLIVNLLAGNTLGPEEKCLRFYSRAGIMSVTDKEFTIDNSLGQKNQILRYSDDEQTRLAGLLENFALSIKSPENKGLYASGIENLRNMAVIEAAYLSSKTGVPEEPGGILEMKRLAP